MAMMIMTVSSRFLVIFPNSQYWNKFSFKWIPSLHHLLESSNLVPLGAHLRMEESEADCTQPANRAAGLRHFDVK